jgi:hypothetical protein
MRSLRITLLSRIVPSMEAQGLKMFGRKLFRVINVPMMYETSRLCRVKRNDKFDDEIKVTRLGRIMESCISFVMKTISDGSV